MRRRRYLQGLGAGIGVPALTGRIGGRGGAVSVAITATNAPVDGGEFLDVTAVVRNGGSESVRPDIDFLVGGERLQTRRTTIGAGEATSVEFSFQTFPVSRDDEFPVRVEVAGVADERTVLVHGIDELPDEGVFPDRELAVEPGTTVVFEVESDLLGEYGGRTRWFVDGSAEGMSMGPWYAEYFAHRGAEYWQYTFDSEGSHNVVAAIAGDEGTARASWTVNVSPDGAGGPTVDETSPPAGPIDPNRVDALEVDVADSDGELDRVVWWLGHADVILGETAVDGERATATLTGDSLSGCHGCPVVVWVVCADGRVVAESPWTFDPGRLSTAIRGTNDPVEGGESLEVTVELENGGGTAITRDVDLVVGHDPERVDSETVSLDPGEGTTLTLGYETHPVEHDQEFPIRVETEDGTLERTVRVTGTGGGGAPVDVTIAGTNAPVEGGEFLEVTARVENRSGESVDRTVGLVAGHDPEQVDSETVSLGPDERATVTLGYETYPVKHDQEFPVRVKSGDAADERIVLARRVGDDSSLRTTILGTNAPVEGGEFLEVTARVENPGRTTAGGDVSLVVGNDPEQVDATSVSLDGGERTTVTLGYETYPVEQDQTFPVRVRTGDDSDERTVTARGQS